jgi:hypothetical protein
MKKGIMSPDFSRERNEKGYYVPGFLRRNGIEIWTKKSESLLKSA